MLWVGICSLVVLILDTGIDHIINVCVTAVFPFRGDCAQSIIQYYGNKKGWWMRKVENRMLWNNWRQAFFNYRGENPL